ncbi:MAG: hypothetical protein LBM25_03480 [Bacteroidales bacterium]|jgi:hypothetical protein|nr:hypothetical protein [Bacteroidales bacterium]
MKVDIGRNYSWLIIFLLGLFYLIFLSRYPSSDAYANAFLSITGKDLFKPHHLLYSGFGYIILKIFNNTSFEPIRILQVVNVLFAILSLIVTRQILKRANQKEGLIASALIFLGSCFGFLRFAVDNECYIIPLFFSIVSINFIQSLSIQTKTYKVVLCGLSTAIGCLFHQIVVFVLICSFFFILFREKFKNVVIFVLISLIIPLVYFLVIYFNFGEINIKTITNFVLHDYVNDTAQMPILKNIFPLFFLSFIRTFIQVHGYIHTIIIDSPIFSYLTIAFSFIFFVLGIVKLFKIKRCSINLFSQKWMVLFLWSLLIFYLAFAIFSNSNAEFMVIVPFLIVFLLVYYLKNIRKSLLYFAIMLLIWNFFFFLIPFSTMKMNNNYDIAKKIHQKEDAIFLLDSKVEVDNIYAYKYRKEPVNTFKPSKITSEEFNNWIKDKKEIYTDVFGSSFAISRKTIVEENTNRKKENVVFSNKNLFKKESEFYSLTSKTEIWSFISKFAN